MTNCSPSSTLASASKIFQQNVTSNGDGYLSWLQQVSNRSTYRYTQQTFIPTAADECEGMAIHWGILKNTSTFILAVAVRAQGWVAFGLSETGGMKGSDIVYLSTQNDTSRLRDLYVTDFHGIPLLDKRQDWILKGYNKTMDGYLIFEAERALDTHDDQDWPILNDTSDFIPGQKVIGAWGDSPFISYHGMNFVQATLRMYPSNSVTETNTTSVVQDENLLSTFIDEMKRRSDGNVVLDIRENFIIPLNESSSREYCYSSSKLVSMGFPRNVFIVGIEFLIPETSRPYVDRIHVFGHPNMHYWFSDSCSDTSIGTSFLWTRGHDFFSFPFNSGVFLGKDGSNALSLRVHFNNYDMYSHASGAGVGARLYYSQQEQVQSVGTLLVGDPMVSMAGQAVGDGWTKHSFTCPSSCSSYILRKAPYYGSVTVFQENFHMHGGGKRMVNQILRNGAVVHEASVDYWDNTQSGVKQVQQEPYVLRRGDEIRTTCYYQSNSSTSFGFGSQNEICMAMLMYYPAQETVFRSICEPDNRLISVCTEKYDQLTLKRDVDIGRIFGRDRLINVPHPSTHMARMGILFNSVLTIVIAGSITLWMWLREQRERRRQEELAAQRRRQAALTTSIVAAGSIALWTWFSDKNALNDREEEQRPFSTTFSSNNINSLVGHPQQDWRRRQEELAAERRHQEELAAGRRRQEELATERRRQEALDAERRRRQDQLEQAKDDLSRHIDVYIRTRKKFDSRDPLAYKCTIASINQDPTIQTWLSRLNGFYKTSLEDFIMNDYRFVVKSDGVQVGVRYNTPLRCRTIHYFYDIKNNPSILPKWNSASFRCKEEENHRVYGYFKCGNGNCGREWESASSWVNKWQQCQYCESKSYPYDQHPLEKSDRDECDSRQPHDTSRCQKCIELGRLCSPKIYYDIRSVR